MATEDDVRRLALGLRGAMEEPETFRFLVEGRAFAWPWLERMDPKKARVPNRAVLAVRIAHEFDKEPLIAMAPDAFFTEPHYDGYAAILVRLDAIDLGLLGRILADGWRSRASKRLLAETWEGRS